MAGALEREAIGLGGTCAFRNHGRADADIELAVTDDSAERHRGFEIAAARNVEHDRALDLAEAVEERE